MAIELPIPCLVCGQTLESAIDARGVEPTSNQPYRATAFTSHGHYGSIDFDEMWGRYLEVNICSPCLRQAGEDGRVLVVEPQIPKNPPAHYSLWTFDASV